MSLAQHLMAQLQGLLSQHHATKVIKVTVEVGPFAGVVIDSFRFCFSTLAGEYPFCAETELEIVLHDPQYRCLDCLAEFHGDGGLKPAQCATCGSTKLLPMGGRDLMLAQVEME